MSSPVKKILKIDDTPENQDAPTNVSATEADSCNPVLQDNEVSEEILTRLRGDAIGDTMYSERFVLSTLLKIAHLNKELSEDEQLEKQLCSVWDMTTEKDVVQFLLEQSTIEVFAMCIDASNDRRLTEILVGILGNMCCVEEARSALAANVEAMTALLSLIDCSDTQTLLQLMRLLTTVFKYANTNEQEAWYTLLKNTPNFISSITFILNNNMNEQLLLQTFEALTAIVCEHGTLAIYSTAREDNPVVDDFVRTLADGNLIKSTLMAFEVLIPESKPKTEGDDVDSGELQSYLQKTAKPTQMFVNFHFGLTRQTLTPRGYVKHLEHMVRCLEIAMEPLSHFAYMPHVGHYETNVLDRIGLIFTYLGDFFHEHFFVSMINVYDVVRRILELRNRDTPPFHRADDEQPQDDWYMEDAMRTALFSIATIGSRTTVKNLEGVVRAVPQDRIYIILKALREKNDYEEIEQCYEKLNSAVEQVFLAEKKAKYLQRRNRNRSK